MAEYGDEVDPAQLGADNPQDDADDEYYPDEMDEDEGYEEAEQRSSDQSKKKKVHTVVYNRSGNLQIISRSMMVVTCILY